MVHGTEPGNAGILAYENILQHRPVIQLKKMRRAFHTPSLQMSYTSCPALRKKITSRLLLFRQPNKIIYFVQLLLCFVQPPSLQYIFFFSLLQLMYYPAILFRSHTVSDSNLHKHYYKCSIRFLQCQFLLVNGLGGLAANPNINSDDSAII